ncbi:LysR family transcriptional regulator [Actibacterium sp. XHP0104]|uniref:LysR family transcriptional regulator n=1 Tax=Actibacterium sp. XHP0104 TaxID=2984335 RepID=UPI0021E92D42|nr:LysR family transcriptional regulator [Actibacterium sp. XHP0104]MCV2880580.1 LysR family transcriptional regulator [Actibacterium sp. XHP0104]
MRHLALYRAIREVVREGSIRKASEKLAISPSALNRQILALEAEIGAPFFDRLPVGVRLSTVGEIYYRQFIEHLADIDRVLETVADLSGTRIGHVRIAMSRVFEQGMLPAHVMAFRADHPNVVFSLLPAGPEEFAELLAEDEADLALIAQPQYRDGIETLQSEELPVQVLMADQGVSGPVGLAELIDLDMVLPPGASGLRAHLDMNFKLQRLPLRPAVESAYLLPPWGAGAGGLAPSAQFCLGPSIDPRWLGAIGGVVRPVARFRPARVALCKREGRILPVAAEKFAMQLGAALADAATAPRA